MSRKTLSDRLSVICGWIQRQEISYCDQWRAVWTAEVIRTGPADPRMTTKKMSRVVSFSRTPAPATTASTRKRPALAGARLDRRDSARLGSLLRGAEARGRR